MCRSLKECVRLKQEYTKEYANQRVILVKLDFPETDIVVTHGDGKSWGYFGTLGEESKIITYCIGRSNRPIQTFLYGRYSKYLGDCRIIVKSNYNSEFNDDYADFINTCFKKNNRYCSKIYTFLFKINPYLLMSMYDIVKWRIDPIYHIQRIYTHCSVNFQEGSIKKAFGFNIKYLKLILINHYSYQCIKWLQEHNYSAEEIKNGPSQWAYEYNFVWADKKVYKKYIECDSTDKSIYYDYLNMRDHMPEEIRSQYPIFPKDVCKWHRRIVADFNREQARIQQAETKAINDHYINEILPLVKKFEYKDDNYSIIACPELIDLTIEGRSLSHCVGSYIDSVSKGNEYILFLRKNDDLNTPFYTIDITPDKRVRQIHGYQNCNVTKELKPFIDEWIEKFKLNGKSYSGVYCAIG